MPRMRLSSFTASMLDSTIVSKQLCRILEVTSKISESDEKICVLHAMSEICSKVPVIWLRISRRLARKSPMGSPFTGFKDINFLYSV